MVTDWNLLAQASELIPSAEVQYRKFNGDAESNDFGIVPQPYGDPVTVPMAHVQPVPSRMYAQLGLQPGRNLRRVFLPADVEGMESVSVGADILLFEGKEWKIRDMKDWFGYDGWKALVVEENKEYPTL